MGVKIDVETSKFSSVASTISQLGGKIYINYKEIGDIVSGFKWKGVSYDEIVKNYNQNAISINKLIILYVKDLPECLTNVQNFYETSDSVISENSSSIAPPVFGEAPTIADLCASNTTTLTFAESNKTTEIKSKFANISETINNIKTSFGNLEWESTNSEEFKTSVTTAIDQHYSDVEKLGQNFCDMLEAKITAIQSAESQNTSNSNYVGSGYTSYNSSSSSGSSSGSSSSLGGSTSGSSARNSSSSDGPTQTVTGSSQLNGNVIDTSTPVGTGTKYNLSQDDLNFLAYVAYREQGSVEGAKIELSLMVNLYEKNKSSYSSVVDYVANSGWFGSGALSSYSYPGDEYVAAAREVVVEGNRYLASNVVEHDCISDISSISTGSRSDRSAYIPGETIINNVYGARYVFIGFAPNGGDPFGYLI